MPPPLWSPVLPGILGNPWLLEASLEDCLHPHVAFCLCMSVSKLALVIRTLVTLDVGNTLVWCDLIFSSLHLQRPYV